MQLKSVLFACGLIAPLIVANKLDRIHVNSDGFFEGEDGTIRFYHGTTYVAETGPGMAQVSDLSMSTAANDWGFSVARVGFEWHLLEPSKGQYNYTYLREMEELVQRFADHGIYSILDMHQDCWSPLYCYHGLPDFYAHPYEIWSYMKDGWYAYPQPLVKPKYFPNATGEFPHIANCDQIEAKLFNAGCYATYAVCAAAQRFYENQDNYMDRFGDMWALVVSRFLNQTAVLGYELLNEPWVGDAYANPILLDAGYADKIHITKMNEYLNGRIRALDNTTIIFFEPATGGNLNFGPVGFTAGPGGPEYNDRQALSYHQYCYGKTLSACEFHVRSMAQIRNSDIKRLGGGGFMSEVGGFGDVRTANPRDKMEASLMFDLIDYYLQSGWSFWIITPDPSVNNETVKFLARTYVRRVQGKPTKVKFDANKGDFTFQFQPHYGNQTDQEQELANIFANMALHYPNGTTCTTDAPDTLIQCAGNGLRNTVLVTLQKQPGNETDLPKEITVTLKTK